MTSGTRTAVTALRGLLLACHPGPTMAVTTITVALAIAVGQDRSGILWTLVAVLAGQLSVGWCNDAHDAPDDTRSGRSEKPIVAGLVARNTVAVAAVLALVLTCVTSFVAGGLRGGPWHLLFVGCAWAYDLRLKQSALSWLPYLVGFGALPVFVTRSVGGWPPWWAVLGAGLLGVAAHLANAAPDIESDTRVGTQGFVATLGPQAARYGTVLLLGAATGVLVLGPGSAGPAPAVRIALLVGAVLVAMVGARFEEGRLLFPAVMILAVLDVVLLVSTAGPAVLGGS